jgi:hypothetical protein
VAAVIAVVPIVGLTARPSGAVVNGSDDVNTPRRNAVVSVAARNGGGCTGSLVAPDRVLTASHCFTVQRPNGSTYANAPAATFYDGNVYVLGSQDGNYPQGWPLWAHTIRGPLAGRTSRAHPTPWGKYTALAPLSANEVLGLTTTKRLVAVNTTTTASRLWGTAPAGAVALAVSANRVYVATAANRIMSSSRSGASWVDAGRASGVRSMTMIGDKLHAVTTSNRLLQASEVVLRGPNGTRVFTLQPWHDIGHANGIDELASFGGQLLALDSAARLWTRWPVPYEENWQAFGNARRYSAMTISGTRFIGMMPISPGDRGVLYLGDVSRQPTRIGRLERPYSVTTAVNAVAMAGTSSGIYVATSNNQLLKRSVSHASTDWTSAGTTPANVMAMASNVEGRLWAATTDNKLWWTSLLQGRATGWTEVSDTGRPAGLTAIGLYGVDPANPRFYGAGGGKLWKRSGYGADAQWTAISNIIGTAVDLAVSADRIVLVRSDGSVWTRPHDPDSQIFDLVSENLVVPGKWLPMNGSDDVDVRLGNDSAGWTDAPAENVFEVTHFQYAGAVDMALLRLARPVPASKAIPIAVFPRPASTPDWSSQSFRIAGWGWLDDAETQSSQFRQSGWMYGGATFPERHLVSVTPGKGGAHTRRGDSGGPLVVACPIDQYCVAGVLNTLDTWAATWVRSTTDSRGFARPNVAAWMERAAG